MSEEYRKSSKGLNKFMQYFRYGHAKDVFVKLGDKVKKGQKIATVGTGNGQWSAHLHFDCPKIDLKSWIGYVFGWTKEEVKKEYADPTPHIKTAFPEYDHMGFGYLEHANYGTLTKPNYCYHPGVDLNGPGAGNADIGDPIYSACDGEVVYCYSGAEHNAGWGKLIVIKELEEKPIIVSKPEDSKNPENEPKNELPIKETPPELITGYDKASGEIITAPTYEELTDPKKQFWQLLSDLFYWLKIIFNKLKK